MSNESIPSREWISAFEASRALQVSPHTFKKLVDMGKITARRIPGARPTFLASDVLKVIKDSTTKANA